MLYAFFYVIALLCYLRYLSTNKMSWYWATFFVFIASCLSKPMAVVFPMSLLCVDVLAGRQLNQKLDHRKASLLLSLSRSYVGLWPSIRKIKQGPLPPSGILTIWERIMYASYSFVMYVAKLFNPTFLSTFYPYPYRFITGYLPSIYYMAPFMALGIIFLIPYLTYKLKPPLLPGSGIRHRLFPGQRYFRAAVHIRWRRHHGG